MGRRGQWMSRSNWIATEGQGLECLILQPWFGIYPDSRGKVLKDFKKRSSSIRFILFSGWGAGGRKHWISGSESWSGGWLGGYRDSLCWRSWRQMEAIGSGNGGGRGGTDWANMLGSCSCCSSRGGRKALGRKSWRLPDFWLG